jgi:hypothetical protein
VLAFRIDMLVWHYYLAGGMFVGGAVATWR